MELRHLRYFVTVAEELNVSRAAKRLHISQPPLSRQIRELENELGLALFERNARAIALTEEGRVFLSEARAVLQRVKEAVAFTQATGQRKQNFVRVGYYAILTVEILPRTLREFQRRYPEVKVELNAMRVSEMLGALRSGAIDFGLSPCMVPEDFSGLTVEEIAAYPFRVAVHKEHRFARLQEVPLSEVACEPHIALSRQASPPYQTLIAKLLLPYNGAFEIKEEYDSSQSVIAAVEAERGVAITPSIVATSASERLVFRPLKPEPQPIRMILAYRPELSSPFITAFASAARSAHT